MWKGLLILRFSNSCLKARGKALALLHPEANIVGPVTDLFIAGTSSSNGQIKPLDIIAQYILVVK